MPFVIACVAAAGLTPLFARIGVRVGLVDRPGELKIHTRPIPTSGGPAVVLSALLAIGLTGNGDPWIAAAVLVALIGGLVDDRRPLAPWIRVVVQAAAGVLLVAGGLELGPLGAAGGVGLVFTTVACCNAVNMADGQDGLASGLGVLAALGLAGMLAADGIAAPVPLAAAGALLGFLLWNRPPARVFLGDGGAYALGVLLAVSIANAGEAGWNGLIAAAVCLGVFAYELISTVVRRVASDRPASIGDRDHSYDRLSRRFGSRVKSTLLMWSFGAACSMVAVDLLGATSLR